VKIYDPPKKTGFPQLRIHWEVMEVKLDTKQLREVALGVVKVRLKV